MKLDTHTCLVGGALLQIELISRGRESEECERLNVFLNAPIIMIDPISTLKDLMLLEYAVDARNYLRMLAVFAMQNVSSHSVT